MDSPFPSRVASSPLEIVRLLELAQAQRVPLTLSLPSDSVAGMTAVLHADAASNTLLMKPVREDAVNRLLVRGGRVVFETPADQLGLMFETPGLSLIDYSGHPALHSPLPERASYAQRRDTFRVDIPTSHGLVCEIWPINSTRKTPFRLKVRDISGTGIALVDSSRSLPVAPGTEYRARLKLPDTDAFEFHLKVVHHQEEWLAMGGRIRRIGCIFDEMGRVASWRVQSYVDALQRIQIARQRGLS